jgi:Leucine-rich repeat (LRR) protein
MRPLQLLMSCLICKVVTLTCKDSNYPIKYQIFNNGTTEIRTSVISTSQPVLSVTVRNQKIDKLCNGLFNLTYKTTELYINNCSVTEIEDQFLQDQDCVEIIIINNNKIRVICRYNFEKLQVQHIDLSSNLIETIDDEAFIELLNLAELHLSDNKMDYFNPKAFVNLPKLGYLDLRNNMIKKLCERSFDFLSNNTAQLHFSNNQIEDISEDVFDGLTPKRMSLHLDNNSLHVLPISIFNGHDFFDVDLTQNKIEEISGLTEDNLTIVILLVDDNLDKNINETLTNWAQKHNITLSLIPDCSLSAKYSRYLLCFSICLTLFAFLN